MKRSEQNKSAPRKRLALGPSQIRSAVANGSRVLDGIDARSAPARRYRDIAADLASDLGGSDALSEMQRQLVRSCAGLIIMREALDARSVNGEPVDSAIYCRITNSLTRTLSALGLERRARDITPSLAEYLQQKAKAEAEHA